MISNMKKKINPAWSANKIYSTTYLILIYIQDIWFNITLHSSHICSSGWCWMSFVNDKDLLSDRQESRMLFHSGLLLTLPCRKPFLQLSFTHISFTHRVGASFIKCIILAVPFKLERIILPPKNGMGGNFNRSRFLATNFLSGYVSLKNN